jgi:class 3 adenylate cyclase
LFSTPDIFGFSAWASEREPFQVFSLLQIMSLKFDKIARKRGVFKVDMIGDVYMACCGVPDAQPDHAARMAKFAQDCITCFKEVTNSLEMTLGPETGDLKIRVGLIASGPSTAGVITGKSSRFQIFGDTALVASRMMDTPKPGRVHLSKNSTTLLLEAGKKRWIQARKELTMVKAQGEMQSSWLVTTKRRKGRDRYVDRIDSLTEQEESDLDLMSAFSGKSVLVWLYSH